MILYKIGPKGGLVKVQKASFLTNEAYLIDDYKNIYVWFGKKISEKHRELGLKKAEQIKKVRKLPPSIQINYESKEYGTFLVMKEILEKGKNLADIMDERAELEIEIDDTMDFLEAGLEPDLEGTITLKAHELQQQGKSYEELCRLLAEKQLALIQGKVSKNNLNIKTKEILDSSATYDELCWLISEIEILMEKKDV